VTKFDDNIDIRNSKRVEIVEEDNDSVPSGGHSNILQSCESNEEVVEKVEYQRDILVKNKNQYKEDDYRLKLATIDKLLSKLRLGLTFHQLDDLKDKRVKIDKIVLDKKIPVDQFKSKIDLTGDRDNNDPMMTVVISGRDLYKNQKTYGTYQPLPKELEKIDPRLSKNRNFGNQKMPQNLLKMINFT
jgi:hypothetical protein